MINLYSPLTDLIIIIILFCIVFLIVKLTLLTQKTFLSVSSEQDKESTPRQIDVAMPYKLLEWRHGWMLVNPNDRYMGKAIIEYGEASEIECEFLVSLLSILPGTVIEVGANMGIDTIPLAKALALQNRSMIVFEPQPFIFQNLCANLALNGLTNVTAWPWACGARSESVSFRQPDYLSQNNFGGVSMSSDATQGNVTVPCIRLDDIEGNDRISLLKIDVEGYELLVLQGAVRILTNSRPLLYVENDRAEHSRALIEWLWSHNYQLFWHIPLLFNPDNFFKNSTNIYNDIRSINMVGVPSEQKSLLSGLQQVKNANEHPFNQGVRVFQNGWFQSS
jgi:FkbM family methyltransferase